VRSAAERPDPAAQRTRACPCPNPYACRCLPQHRTDRLSIVVALDGQPGDGEGIARRPCDGVHDHARRSVSSGDDLLTAASIVVAVGIRERHDLGPDAILQPCLAGPNLVADLGPRQSLERDVAPTVAGDLDACGVEVAQTRTTRACAPVPAELPSMHDVVTKMVAGIPLSTSSGNATSRLSAYPSSKVTTIPGEASGARGGELLDGAGPSPVGDDRVEVVGEHRRIGAEAARAGRDRSGRAALEPRRILASARPRAREFIRPWYGRSRRLLNGPPGRFADRRDTTPRPPPSLPLRR
jgi:hypothetical protein